MVLYPNLKHQLGTPLHVSCAKLVGDTLHALSAKIFYLLRIRDGGVRGGCEAVGRARGVIQKSWLTRMIGTGYSKRMIFLNFIFKRSREGQLVFFFQITLNAVILITTLSDRRTFPH